MANNSKLKNPVYAYWNSVKKFLDASSKFAQTWSLYEILQRSENLAELMAEEAGIYASGSKPSPAFKRKITSVRYYNNLMQVAHQCPDLKTLYYKAKSEWRVYKDTFYAMRGCARKAGVDPGVSDNYRSTFMWCFVLESYDGPCRREFYRRRVDRALKKFDKDPDAVEATNIRELEAAFGADEKFKESFARKKLKAKERDRENREARNAKLMKT